MTVRRAAKLRSGHPTARKASSPAPASAPLLRSVQARRYDGASLTPRTEHWRAPSSDATSAIDRPSTLRNRARDLARNNPWAARGISALVNNSVGYGIQAQWKGRRAQAQWMAWADSADCDATGMTNFAGLQQLAFRTMVESGECLVRLRPRLSSDGLAAPFQIQILEPDHLVETLDGPTKVGGLISRGIEYDGIGRRVAYYLYRTHPGAASRGMFVDVNAYSRVPASEIIHLFRRDRPGQERGVSWLASSIITLRDLDLYEDAYLKRQQVANLFAAFVTTDEDPAGVAADFTPLDEGLQPGSIYVLNPGRGVEFNSPPPAGDYGPFTMECLRRVAAGLGITFEALTGNLSQVNFSSARMGWQEMGRNIDTWRWNLFIPLFCGQVAKWFGAMTGTPGAPTWTPPARTLVDPTREIPALESAIRAGLMTQSEALREQGYDPETWLAEKAADDAELDRLAISLSSDPRRDKIGGAIAQQKTAD